MRFFLIALIFLVFDVEVVILFPSITSILATDKITVMNLTLAFLIALISGLFYEANQGSLD